MKLEDIQSLWDVDCKIDKSQLDDESIHIPQLHNKYYKIFREERKKYRKVLLEKKRGYTMLYDYFSGTFNTDMAMLNAIGRTPVNKKYTRETIERLVNQDQLYIALCSEVEDQEDIVETLQEIIKTIGNRSYVIKGAVEFMKFAKGDY